MAWGVHSTAVLRAHPITRPRRAACAAVAALTLGAAARAHLGGFEAADGYAPFLNMVQNYNAGQYGANSCDPNASQMAITPNTGLWEALAGGFFSAGGVSYATGHSWYDRTWVNSGNTMGSASDQALVLTTGHEGYAGPALKYKYTIESCDLDGCEPADTGNSIVKVSFWVCWQLDGPGSPTTIPVGYFGDEISFLDSSGNVGFTLGLTQRPTGDTVTYWNGASLFESTMVGAAGRYDRWEITFDLANDTVSADFTPFSTGIPVTLITGAPMMTAMADFSAMTFRTSPGTTNAKLMSVDDFEFETDCSDQPCVAELLETYCELDGTGNVTASIKVTNNSDVDATRILITALPPGSPTMPMPNVINQPVPANGGMHTFNVTFNNLIPGQEFCFVVTLLDRTGNVCCSTVICFTPECDCLQIRDANEYIVCSPDGVPGSYLYTFQFDNLTPDTIHHVYFFPPAGVTISPNYVAMVPPVGPNQTSQQIMVMITGATPGTELCFDIAIHDEHLMECCTKEVCIDIPFCDDEQPRGACCFQEPGVPAPGCIVTTAADCAQTYHGVYQGDNTTCVPSPCLPPADDSTTHLTPLTRCCWPDDQFATTTLTICNNSSIPRNYSWMLDSVVGANCPVAIPPSFIMPNMGNLTLQPGECRDIQIRIQCEGTLQSPNGMSCLEATVTDLTSNTVYMSQGKVMTNDASTGQLPPWCIRVADPFDPTIAFPPGADYINASFLITNNTDEPRLFDYSVNGGGTVSINGQPSGIAMHNAVVVPPNATLPILYAVSLTDERPAEVFDSILFADLDGDGSVEPVLSQGFQSASGEPCLGDANGDNVVNFADLNTILACFGVSGEPGLEGDLTRDGVVDFADLNIVLSNFGRGCN